MSPSRELLNLRTSELAVGFRSEGNSGLCPLTGQVALILSSTPSASGLFRISVDPISASLLNGKNWFVFLWRLSAALIVNLRKDGLEYFSVGVRIDALLQF